MAPPKGFSNALSMFMEKFTNKVEIDLTKKDYPILSFVPMDSKGAEGSGYDEPFVMDGMNSGLQPCASPVHGRRVQRYPEGCPLEHRLGANIRWL